MRKAFLLAAALAMGMTVSAHAQLPPIQPTGAGNGEVNLINFATGGNNLSSSSPTDYSVSLNNGTAGGTDPSDQQSIMGRLYGASSNYTLLNDSQTQTFLNTNGIALMATVKYAGDNNALGYFTSSAKTTADFQNILTVSGPSAAGEPGGFLSNPGSGLTVTAGSGATVVGPDSFLLTPSQSGSPFQFALFNGTNYYSSDTSSTVSGLTDPGGFDHLAVFQLNTPGNGYVLAWEDGVGGGDSDYNDLVVQINYVPEPSSLAIAGLGALGMVGYGLRRRKALGV